MIHAKPSERAKLEREAKHLELALSTDLPRSSQEILSAKLRDVRAALFRLEREGPGQ